MDKDDLILDHLRTALLDRTHALPPQSFITRGAWDMLLLFQPSPAERIFDYRVVIVQTEQQGACYSQGEALPSLKQLLGVDARLHQTGVWPLDIALLDAAYSVKPEAPAELVELSSSPREKAVARAEMVVAEVLQLLMLQGRGEQARVSVIGTIGSVIAALRRTRCQIRTADLDPKVVGLTIEGVTIESGVDTLALVKDSHVSIVTGMTLATRTFAGIVQCARESNTHLIVLAETGAWFGFEYCRLGVDVVIAEPFPFYIFAGHTRFFVHRALRPRMMRE